jgi:formylglycine-generating enzyme required for sulfatase activity
MGAVQLKELAWVLAGKLRSSALVADVPCMVYVKGGTFTMGFLPGRDGTDISEALNACPAKAGVEVGDFWIGRHEITVKEWKVVMGKFPTLPGDVVKNDFNQDKKPAVYMHWSEAQSYVTKLNASMVNTGMVFKLPTEAQWEYAARGGVKMYDRCENGCMYSGSNDIDEVGWYEATWELAGYAYPPDVETKQPNELGIYDMTGCVYEWCMEDWRVSCNDKNPVPSKYATRGGCWKNAIDQALVASRSTTKYGASGTNVGFRVV